ncbi:MAG: hypothetical protein ACLPX1_11660 [Steroidobacteraceae bacterium]
MTLTALIAAFGLAGILCSIAALRRLRRRRLLSGAASAICAIALFLLVVCALLIAADVRSYRRLGAEQPAGEIVFSNIGEHQFNGILTYPGGEREAFSLRGDQWQVDARILKWSAFGNLMGFDAAYRLERISGRYSRIEDERGLPRTVYPLNAPHRLDLWELVRRCRSWLPWFDAIYGSAVYLPMTDAASYEIKVSQSGLVARPLNQAAKDAVGNWR